MGKKKIDRYIYMYKGFIKRCLKDHNFPMRFTLNVLMQGYKDGSGKIERSKGSLDVIQFTKLRGKAE